MKELLFSSAAAMARAIREREVSSTELVQAHLTRIEEVNPKLNAVVQVCAERALCEAQTADRAMSRGEVKGPLHGVPVTFKDAIETAGIISTGGTLGRRAYIPNEDATVVRRLRAAGAIVLGKTNCPELGWAWESDNLIYGRTNNPYNHALSPGGSSGGESAIIAAGGSPLGLGSDAGGSVRFPAHCCGIASIKPTSGRVPRTGHFPGPGGLLDALWAIGPMARRVEDLDLALKIVSGIDWRDPSVIPVPFGDSGSDGRKKLCVAFHTDNGIVSPEPEISDAVQKSVAALCENGIIVKEKRPCGIEQSYELFRDLFCADRGEGLESLLASANTTEFHPLMQQALEMQRSRTMAEFGELIGRWDCFRKTMLGFMEGYDAVLCPVCSFSGMEHSSTYQKLPCFSYTMAYNLTGWPAAVVRAGRSKGGLPIGVQIVAPPWGERTALEIASCIEMHFGGWYPPSI